MKKNQIECADMGNIITKIKSPKAAMRGDLGRGGLDGSGYLDSAEMRRWRHGGRVTDTVTEGDIPNALKGKPGGATRQDGAPRQRKWCCTTVGFHGAGIPRFRTHSPEGHTDASGSSLQSRGWALAMRHS